MRLLRLLALAGVIALLPAASLFAAPASADDPEQACRTNAWCSRWLSASSAGAETASTPLDTGDAEAALADEPEIIDYELYAAMLEDESVSEAEGLAWDASIWIPHRDYWPDQASVLTYEDLTREIAAFLEGSNGAVGVALYRPGDSFLAGFNLDGMLPLASVAKIEILLAYLGYAEGEGRELDEGELSMLDAMITYSDNYSADLLWEYLGGNPAVQAFLTSHGLTESVASEIGTWGSTMDSPRNLALLLGQLHSGRLLNEANTALALDLLQRVAVEQRWGITAGIEDGLSMVESALEPELGFSLDESPLLEEPFPWEEANAVFGPFWPDEVANLTADEPKSGFIPPATVYLKDGWYPGEEGWRLNSAGIVQPGDGSPAYVLVVLTDGQPGYEYGIETISTIAGLVNAFMLNPSLPVPLFASAPGSILDEAR